MGILFILIGIAGFIILMVSDMVHISISVFSAGIIVSTGLFILGAFWGNLRRGLKNTKIRAHQIPAMGTLIGFEPTGWSSSHTSSRELILRFSYTWQSGETARGETRCSVHAAIEAKLRKGMVFPIYVSPQDPHIVVLQNDTLSHYSLEKAAAAGGLGADTGYAAPSTPPIPTEKMLHIRQLVADGQTLAAIKAYKDEMRCSLEEACDVVDAIAAEGKAL